MKYETPEMTVLTPAIHAVQTSSPIDKNLTGPEDSRTNDVVLGAYADWE